MSVELEEAIDVKTTDPDKKTEDPIYAHWIERDENRSAEAIIMEARVNGTPLTALCGHVWVPSRDPERHPPCPRCEEALPFAKDMRG